MEGLSITPASRCGGGAFGITALSVSLRGTCLVQLDELVWQQPHQQEQEQDRVVVPCAKVKTQLQAAIAVERTKLNQLNIQQLEGRSCS